MLKWVFRGGLLILVVLVGAYFVGIRIFVIPPIGALPEGGTAVVVGVSGLNFVDSPDAFCMRNNGYVNLFCRAGVMGGVGEHGTILLRLPYSRTLLRLSGAPEI